MPWHKKRGGGRDDVGIVPYAPIEKTKRAGRKQSFLSAFFHKRLSKSQGT